MDYRAEDIQVIQWHEAIRRRPKMYLGDTGRAGLLFLARELLECPQDPSRLIVTLNRTRMEIFAVSMPISVRPRSEDKPIYLIEVLTETTVAIDTPASVAPVEILDTRVRPAVFRRISAATGMLAVANAFSAEMSVTSRRAGIATAVTFSRGVLLSGPTESATTEGVTISIVPDQEIFQDSTLRFEFLAEVIRDFSLRRNVPVQLNDVTRDLLFEMPVLVGGLERSPMP